MALTYGRRLRLSTLPAATPGVLKNGTFLTLPSPPSSSSRAPPRGDKKPLAPVTRRYTVHLHKRLWKV